MIRPFIIYLGLGMILSASTCSKDATTSGLDLPADVTLKFGEKIELNTAAGIQIVQFTGPTADSRCPDDVQCPWQGLATSEITVTDANGNNPAKGTVNIEGLCDAANNGGKPCGAEVTIQKLKITPMSLNPYPKNTITVPQADYILKLHITE